MTEQPPWPTCIVIHGPDGEVSVIPIVPPEERDLREIDEEESADR